MIEGTARGFTYHTRAKAAGASIQSSFNDDHTGRDFVNDGPYIEIFNSSSYRLRMTSKSYSAWHQAIIKSCMGMTSWRENIEIETNITTGHPLHGISGLHTKSIGEKVGADYADSRISVTPPAGNLARECRAAPSGRIPRGP